MVTDCEYYELPSDDGELDIALFSFSLMGSNSTDYIKEGHRTLKLDGTLHIWESTSRFKDRDQFINDLKTLGFAGIDVEDEWKFTHITATKRTANPRQAVSIVRGLGSKGTHLEDK